MGNLAGMRFHFIFTLVAMLNQCIGFQVANTWGGVEWPTVDRKFNFVRFFFIAAIQTNILLFTG